MLQSLKNDLIREHECGILEKSGPAFRTPTEFALRNLSYIVWSNKYTCDRSYVVTHNSVSCYSLIYVEDGNLEVFTAGKRYTVKKEEAIFVDFSREHSYRCSSDTVVKWEMIMNGELVKAYAGLIEESWGAKFQVSGRVAMVLRRLQRELDDPLTQDHSLACLIHKLFCEIIDQNTSGLSPEVVQAISFMYENYSKDLCIEDIAEVVSFSRSYFSRIFLKETGYTPKDFLLNIRIKEAQNLLESQRDLPMVNIAEQCGFANASHFSRLFKIKTGSTPKAFRDRRERW